MSAPEYPPGSPDVVQGCICPPTLNRRGRGTLHGQPRLYYDRKCPVHRDVAEKRAVESGEVRVVRKDNAP
jgi:hypothetical protein